MQICLPFFTGTLCRHETARKDFDGSTILFRTQRALYNSIGHAIWLGQFTYVRHDYPLFVQALLQAFCSLGICCAITGQYPAYIAGMLSRHTMEEEFCVCHLYFAKSTSANWGPFLRKAHEFKIGSFDFRFKQYRDYEHFPDYSTYKISYEGETLTFQLVLVDGTLDCGPRSLINFAEFVREKLRHSRSFITP